MNEFYIVTKQSGGFAKGSCANPHYSVYQFEKDAIDEAKRQAILNNEPFEVYTVTLIGASCLPQSRFADYRPQSAI